EVADELAQIDGGLVTRCEQQSFPTVVLALDEERPPERQQRAQHEAEPQHTRQHGGQSLAVAAERELKDEEQEQREEDERVQRLLRAALDREILPRAGQRPLCPAHSVSSVWAAWRR